MPPSLIFSVLGPVAALAGDGSRLDLGARKPITVLALLLVHANAWVPATALIAATWPEHAVPASADANLKTYVWQLRKTLPPPASGRRIESARGAYRLRVEPGEVDLDVVELLATRARLALTDGDPRGAAALASEALGRWHGEPFGGLPLDALADAVARTERVRTCLRTTLADSLVDLGDVVNAVALLRELVDEDPLAEDHWSRWMTVLSRAGRHREALAVHQRARAVLRAELDVEPGPALAAAHRVALRGSCVQNLPRDLPDFTGRAVEVDRLAALAAGGGVAVVDGPAGVGKSALAVHVAHRVAEAFPDGRLHVDLRELSPEAALLRLLRAMGAAVRTPDDLDGLAATWRAELACRRVLLVLDDAVSARQVRPLLPGTSGCLVLVTTRDRRPLVDGAATLTLGPLPPEEAAALFGSACGDWRADAETAAVAEVVRLCGGLPAALRAAGARLRGRPMWTVSALVARLSDGSGRIAELSEITAPLARAYRALPPAARRVLHALARGESAVVGTEARAVLEDLLDQHLVVQASADDHVLHPLVRDVVRRAATLADRPTKPRVA